MNALKSKIKLRNCVRRSKKLSIYFLMFIFSFSCRNNSSSRSLSFLDVSFKPDGEVVIIDKRTYALVSLTENHVVVTKHKAKLNSFIKFDFDEEGYKGLQLHITEAEGSSVFFMDNEDKDGVWDLYHDTKEGKIIKGKWVSPE